MNDKVLDREAVYDMLTKEDEYAQGWSKSKKSATGNHPDHMVSRRTGLPFSEMEWIVFVEKYLNEAKLAYANYCPDERVIRIRLLKAASLLVSALQVSGQPSDLEDIAGVSSSKFPYFTQGLKDLKTSDKPDVI